MSKENDERFEMTTWKWLGAGFLIVMLGFILDMPREHQGELMRALYWLYGVAMALAIVNFFYKWVKEKKDKQAGQ